MRLSPTTRRPRIVQPPHHQLADRRPVARRAVDAETVAGGNGADAPAGAPVGARPPKQPRVGSGALHPPNGRPDGRLAVLVGGMEKRRGARAEGGDDHLAVCAAAGGVQHMRIIHS